jgi:hypothetical protein
MSRAAMDVERSSPARPRDKSRRGRDRSRVEEDEGVAVLCVRGSIVGGVRVCFVFECLGAPLRVGIVKKPAVYLARCVRGPDLEPAPGARGFQAQIAAEQCGFGDRALGERAAGELRVGVRCERDSVNHHHAFRRDDSQLDGADAAFSR